MSFFFGIGKDCFYLHTAFGYEYTVVTNIELTSLDIFGDEFFLSSCSSGKNLTLIWFLPSCCVIPQSAAVPSTAVGVSFSAAEDTQPLEVLLILYCQPFCFM